MTDKEILEMIRDIKDGAAEKISIIWLELLPWTRKICLKYIKPANGTRYYELEDLVNCSYFALLQAIYKCDYIEEYINDPFGIFKFMKYYVFQIQGETKKDRKRYRQQDVDTKLESLNQIISSENDSEKLDFIMDENAASNMEAAITKIYREQLHEAFRRYDEILTVDEKEVIHKLYYEKKGYKDAARELNCSVVHIREIERRAFRKYRKPYDRVDLRAYLTGVY